MPVCPPRLRENLALASWPYGIIMTSTSAQAGLLVKITFDQYNQRILTIGFRNHVEAYNYHRHIISQPLHISLSLTSRLNGVSVSTLLPTDLFTEIVASITFGGFYLIATNPRLAEQWAKSFPMWRSVDGNYNKLYVYRQPDYINAMPPPPSRTALPQAHQPLPPGPVVPKGHRTASPQVILPPGAFVSESYQK